MSDSAFAIGMGMCPHEKTCREVDYANEQVDMWYERSEKMKGLGLEVCDKVELFLRERNLFDQMVEYIQEMRDRLGEYGEECWGKEKE